MIEQTQIHALINLLDDPDDAVYSQVENKLLSIGESAYIMLEKALENTTNTGLYNRIESIMKRIHVQTIHNYLFDWKQNSADDLFKGFYYLSKYRNPNLEYEHIHNIFSKIKKDIWMEINEDLTPLEKIKVLNHIVFDIHKYKAITDTEKTDNNFFIENVFEKKQGNNISLSLGYLSLAQSLNIPLYGVNLPGHFMIAYKNEIDFLRKSLPTGALFYINVQNKGAISSIKELKHYLAHLKIEENDSYFKICNNIITLKVFLDLLSKHYKIMNKSQWIEDVEYIKSALS